MASPVRICQPASESRNSFWYPWKRNSQENSVTQAVANATSGTHQPSRAPGRGMDFQRYCCAPMLDRSPVILWYRLTIPWESWFTVVIKASPTAATISAYSTRSCPCSSRIKPKTSTFIVPLSVNGWRRFAALPSANRLMGLRTVYARRLETVASVQFAYRAASPLARRDYHPAVPPIPGSAGPPRVSYYSRGPNPVRGEPRNSSPFPSTPPPCCYAPWRGRRWIASWRPRSEEHTSELQS